MNPRIFIALAALAAFLMPLLTATMPAQARPKYHHYHPIHHHYRHIDRLSPMQAYRADQACVFDNNGHVTCQAASKRISDLPVESRHRTNKVRRLMVGNEGIIGGRPSGCPHAYCGCEASRYLFGKIIPELNRAAAWFKFPHADPAPNMVAVRNHHVFVILSVNGDGTVLAHDGNSGHGLIREHVVSLRGYSVRDPHGIRIAMR